MANLELNIEFVIRAEPFQYSGTDERVMYLHLIGLYTMELGGATSQLAYASNRATRELKQRRF